MLDYGTGFELIHADTAEEAADKVEQLYRAEVVEHGVDSVQVLTPFRKRGDASVDSLNARLWEIVNPREEGKQEMKAGRRTFREGDRIIHNKNKNQISNGDVGYLTDMYQDEEGIQLARLQFSEGRSVNYTGDELDMVEHAYATTVHKSQGSEFEAVILPLLPSHQNLYYRNLLYTAVTRAQRMVILVGREDVIRTMVDNDRQTLRYTGLTMRLKRA